MADAPVLRTVDIPRCPICGGAGRPAHRGIPDISWPEGQTWGFRRCADRRCGHYWLDPAPVAEDLHLAYGDYAPHREPGAQPQAASPLSPLGRAYFGLVRRSGIARRRQEMFHYDLPAGEGRRLLEVGCGNGSRLAALRARGWDVEGQDLSPVAVQVARRHAGVPVHLGDLEELDIPPRSFDVVAMNHVIEHVPDPVRFLRRCRALLKPGGTVVSLNPNGSSLMHRLAGRHWVGLDVPRHLHAFTLKSMRRALGDAGFQAVRVRSVPYNTEAWFPMTLGFRRIHRRAPHRRRAGAVTTPIVQLLSLAAWPLLPGRAEEMLSSAQAPGPVA